MDLTLNADQAAALAGLDQVVARFETSPREFVGTVLTSVELEEALDAGQYFNIARVPELGPLCAALAVERLARLPYAVEAALSMLVRPRMSGDVPRPLALVEHGGTGRFVAGARTILAVDGETIGVARVESDMSESVESLYAYPMGRLAGRPKIEPLPASEAAVARTWLRIALACEISGLLRAAITATADHLNNRQQFGRPLATFQALRHRLAECSVLAGGVRWLALRASWSGQDGDAALAALHAQQSATQIVYDLHQMHGGIGITLEHPLHLWTYRLKALLSDLGGRASQARAVAQYCFG
jgi:hypothetical protein